MAPAWGSWVAMTAARQPLGSALNNAAIASRWRASSARSVAVPYRPQTNGKVERWIRTVLSECLYREVFGSSEQRRLALARFVLYYNEIRPHLGIGGRTPRWRLELKLAA